MYRCYRPHARSTAGFTLIEMMITVAIVAILAAIALPAYTNQIRKSRRGDAKIALLDMAARQERYNTINFRYATAVTDLGYPGATISIPGTGTPYYTLSMNVPAAATTFILTATAVNDQANDACRNFTLTDLGVQGLQGAPASAIPDCWK